MNQLKKKRTEVRTQAVCRTCQGTGLNPNLPENLAKQCADCQGSGVVDINKVIYTTIKPGKA